MTTRNLPLSLGEMPNETRLSLPLSLDSLGRIVTATGDVVATLHNDARRSDDEPTVANLAPLFIEAPNMLRILERALVTGRLDGEMRNMIVEMTARVRG